MIISCLLFTIIAIAAWALYGSNILSNETSLTSGIVGNVSGILSILSLMIYVI